MRILTNIIIITIFVTALFSCKKKYDKEFMGPQVKEEIKFKLVDSLKTNGGFIADFSITNTVPFFFKAKFDKSITWKLTIEGDTSGAIKTFIGTSAQIDSMTSTWRGEQDSLYYFTKETCKVTLSDYYPINGNNVYATHSQNSIITETPLKLTTSISINISNPKPLPENAVLIFDRKRADGAGRPYGVNYDSESCGGNAEASTDILIDGTPTCLSKEYLPYSKKGGPIQRFYKSTAAATSFRNSPYYFKLKGTDSYNKDYYVGRIEYFRGGSSYGDFLDSRRGLINPEDLWFNVFVYGTGDGAKLNYTVKEDDDKGGFMTGRSKPCGYTKAFTDSVMQYDIDNKIVQFDLNNKKVGTQDDAFEHQITLDFIGWRLISVPYSKFDQVAVDGFNSNGDGTRNVDKIYAVQFSLVAPGKGKSGQAIFDYPVMSIGGPLKY